MVNYSMRKFVTSVEVSKAPFSSTLTRLHGCYSLLSVVRMERMIRTGSLLYTVGKTHRIIVFADTTVIMEVNSHMEAAS